VAVLVGVDGVGLVELAHAAHAFEKEGHERPALLLGEFREDPVETRGVVAHAGRHALPDEEHAGVGLLREHPGRDGLEVALHEGGIEAAQPVVAAEGEDEDRDRLAQHPVDAAQAAGGGVARDAGVDHPPAGRGRTGGGGEGV